MNRARFVLLTGILLLGGLLALPGRSVPDRALAAALALEGLTTNRSVASELHESQPGQVDPAPAPDRRLPPYHRRPLPRWDGMSVSLEILVADRPLATVWHRGRAYLPVPRLGVEYEIRVSNHGPRRIAAMVSVDGLSVINGKPASENHAGYLVAPRGSVVIKGWRRDMEKVAAFSFEERDKSYASRVGRPENVGIIGLVAIEEQGRPPRPYLELKDRAAPARKKGSADVGNTGTGYGRDIDSPIYYVPFVRSANKRTVTFYYDTPEALRLAGVPVDGTLPVPFPGDQTFVPPPPKVKGK